MVHPLALLLDGAAHDRFPEPDGKVRVLPPLPDGVDALVAFTGTFVLTGEIPQGDVDARVPVGGFSVPMAPAFVQWVADALGARIGTLDLVCVTVAPGAGEPAGDDPLEDLIVEVAVSDHPRVAEASRSRRDLRVYETVDQRGVVVLGRGITNRWEIAYEVDPSARGVGLGRALVRAAVQTLPAGTPVWAQVAPGNTASVRGVLAAGFRPAFAEILFVREPR